MPVEVDDAYGYILKAEEMRSCFLQECRALNDLRAQFTSPNNDADLAYVRAREYHRLFVIYHPLHSLGLNAINSFFSYDVAYNTLAILSKIILCTGVAFFLAEIYGLNVSAVTLFLLSPVVFPGQGIHTMVPSNMALGLAFIAIAIALRAPRGAWKVLIPLIWGMVLLHQVGKLYAGVVILVFTLRAQRHFSREIKWTLVAASGIVAFSFLLPMVINKPELNFDPGSFETGKWNYLKELAESLPNSLNIFNVWFSAFSYRMLGLALPTLGLLFLPANRRLGWLFTFAAFASLLLLALFYVTPWFGAFVFERIWVPLAILLLGLVGQLTYSSLKIALGLFANWFSSKRLVETREGSYRAIGLVFIVIPLLAYGLHSFSSFYLRHYSLTLENQIQRQNISIDNAQPKDAFSMAESDTTFIYLDEIGLYYYLTYGGLDYGAVFYPAVKGTDEESLIAKGDFVVSNNLIYRLSNSAAPIVVLDDNATLRINGVSDLAFTSIQINISTKNRPTELHVVWKAGSSDTEQLITVAPQNDGWVQFTQSEFEATSIEITLVGKTALQIDGIRFTDGATTNWPWDPGVTLEVTSPSASPVLVEISEKALVGELPINIDVLNDNGYTVLAKVIH